MRILIVLLLITLLCSCAEQPAKGFGVTTSDWNGLSTPQRQAVIANYTVPAPHYATAPKVTMTEKTDNYQNQLSNENPIQPQNAKPITVTQTPKTAPAQTEPTPTTPKQDANWLKLH